MPGIFTDCSAGQGEFSQTGCRPAKKLNAEQRKKIHRPDVFTFFKQGPNLYPHKSNDIIRQSSPSK